MIGFLAALTIAVQFALVVLASVLPAAIMGWSDMVGKLSRAVAPDAMRLIALVAGVATAGSLYMSEIRHFEPCPLCWYQRIAMYSLVIVSLVAAIRRDNIWPYTLALSLTGLVVSIYHYQLERFPDQKQLACSADVACTTIWFEVAGYVTIPLMAATAFAAIAVLSLMARKEGI